MGRTIAWDREKQPGLIALEDVTALVLEESAYEGHQACAELHHDATRYRLGLEVAILRTERRLTQAELAARAGIAQAALSELERGLANPTLATLGSVDQALECGLEIGA